ncbi:hypothetical protein [Lyngbya sp. CCY1209]|uniref:hypothetical protein n=1 Tax=Lyngbya sp. CCY1209 TaxID=2886103 RepID=UPI002D211670|nr:hypothetical protein [Lyngbya sp. CCY1209]MEB3884448.1 Uma2 family endonuclease [Lyngbya sp. CCY1209]
MAGLAAEIITQLQNWVRPRQLGRVIASSGGFPLPNTDADLRSPDASFTEKLGSNCINFLRRSAIFWKRGLKLVFESEGNKGGRSPDRYGSDDDYLSAHGIQLSAIGR